MEESQQRASYAKYISLPLNVKVIKYNGSIHPDSFKVSDDTSYPYDLMKSRMPESISYFTPIIESDKKVLYLSPEAQELLSSFIDEPKMMFDERDYTFSIRKEEITDEDWEEVIKRRDMIGKYVPTIVAHWGNGWYFTSYPLIRRIIVGDDGYYTFTTDVDDDGYEVTLFDANGEKVDKIDSGIQNSVYFKHNRICYIKDDALYLYNGNGSEKIAKNVVNWWYNGDAGATYLSAP